MSDFLGYVRGVSYNNDIINRNKQLQSNIHQSNINNLTNYNVVEKQSKGNYDATEKSLEHQEGDIKEGEAKSEGGEFLNDVRNTYKTTQKYIDIGKGIKQDITNLKRSKFIAKSGADADLRGDTRVGDTARSEVLDLGQDTSDITDDVSRGGNAISRGADLSGVLNYGGEALQNTLQGGARGVSEAFTGARDTANAISSGAEALQSGDIGGVVDAGSKTISSISKVSGALDTLGKAGEGVAVLSAGSDIYDDATGGFSKMNTGEKVGNVAGIGAGVFSAGSLAGGLEYTGAMLDATGIGAELGVAFNVAGAIAGGISAISDYFGSKSAQKTQQAPMKVAKAPTPTPQAQAPISALQSGGVALSGYN